MDHPTLLDEMRAFSEAEYLTLHPDVARGVNEHVTPDGWTHYERDGRKERRPICAFDEPFYLRTYPLVAREIAGGRAENAYEHYIMYGHARGYLPRRGADRPRNPTATLSPFGGLWVDTADALDRVHGRYQTGQITATQAARLERFVRDGYILLRDAVPEEMVRAAEADLDRAYRGEISGLRFECAAMDPGGPPWQPVVADVPAKALDIHHFSKPIRQLIFAPIVTEFLALIFENKAFASQTLGFLRGSAQGSHQDTAFVPYTSALGFAASWIALEDVTAGAGELFYYKGSHRMPDFYYDEKYKSAQEAWLINGKNSYKDQIETHVDSLDKNAARFGLERQVLMAKRGDVLIWHADLTHGGQAVSRDITRKSIVAHYCPRHIVPLFCEAHQVDFFDFEGHAFTSSHYRGVPLVD